MVPRMASQATAFTNSGTQGLVLFVQLIPGKSPIYRHSHRIGDFRRRAAVSPGMQSALMDVTEV